MSWRSIIVQQSDDETAFSLDALAGFCNAILAGCGADQATADAATRAMMHGTRLGVDSHGVRLLSHYVTALVGGRVNKTPRLRAVRSFGAIETLDADHAHGALAAFTAMARATTLADQFGIGAVAIQNSSHFAAAGAYALQAANQGYIGIAVCNSDSFVRLHDGAMRFHGTNPIAVGVPTTGAQPWLLDMATSSIPYNRVMLYQSLGVPLPQGVASDPEGVDTLEAEKAAMLAPLGGEFGFKGAALAGLAEILSAVLTGMTLSFDIAPMGGPDFSTPRKMGAFVLALKPAAFIDPAVFDAGMTRYLDTLRNSPARPPFTVMAPGDREWRVAEQRQQQGVTIDPMTLKSFADLAARFRVAAPAPIEKSG
ncbi:Ldh family oxidoreductase [Ochrobactrum sp. S46]|uniref:Ldh family oxidoreductase n=1 Tax=Brucella pseudogrignonensis TaxID=419475 RepID=UPI00190946A3|nr:Ldh family oxidoreductase [Ochrobactrum sp. S45]MBK0045026.1 Ldh family oxidoreductase [Ochrobactrum sp. S46]